MNNKYKFKAWDKERKRDFFFYLENLVDADGYDIEGETELGGTIWCSWFLLENIECVNLGEGVQDE